MTKETTWTFGDKVNEKMSTGTGNTEGPGVFENMPNKKGKIKYSHFKYSNSLPHP